MRLPLFVAVAILVGLYILVHSCARAWVLVVAWRNRGRVTVELLRRVKP